MTLTPWRELEVVRPRRRATVSAADTLRQVGDLVDDGDFHALCVRHRFLLLELEKYDLRRSSGDGHHTAVAAKRNLGNGVGIVF